MLHHVRRLGESEHHEKLRAALCHKKHVEGYSPFLLKPGNSDLQKQFVVDIPNA